jgi:hypothetical protein
MGTNHRGLNRFHRGHAAYIPYMVYRRDLYESDSWYIGRVTSMKAIQAPATYIPYMVYRRDLYENDSSPCGTNQ